MVEPVTTLLLTTLGFAIAGAAAVLYWTKILQWAEDNLYPWMREYAPGMEDVVRAALAYFDKIATPAYALALENWRQLRKTVVSIVEEFEQITMDTWLLKVTSTVRVRLSVADPEPVIKEVHSEQRIAYRDLPPEVREQLIRRGVRSYKIDVTSMRDAELGLAMGT
jgi:hypothetical protein